MRTFSDNRPPQLHLGHCSSHNITDFLQHSTFGFDVRNFIMRPLNDLLPESTSIIDNNRAVQDGLHDISYDAFDIQSPSRPRKSKEKVTLSDSHQQQTQSYELRTIEEVEEVDEQLSIRKELEAVRANMVQLKQERDMAVDKATRVSIQLVDLKVETDESLDQVTAQLTESHALVEQMMCQQGTPIKREMSNRSIMSSNRSVASSNRSVASSNRSVVSSSRSVMSSNAEQIVEASNPFYL
jgi:hypothetical protein